MRVFSLTCMTSAKNPEANRVQIPSCYSSIILHNMLALHSIELLTRIGPCETTECFLNVKEIIIAFAVSVLDLEMKVA